MHAVAAIMQPNILLHEAHYFLPREQYPHAYERRKYDDGRSDFLSLSLCSYQWTMNLSMDSYFSPYVGVPLPLPKMFPSYTRKQSLPWMCIRSVEGNAYFPLKYSIWESLCLKQPVSPCTLYHCTYHISSTLKSWDDVCVYVAATLKRYTHH